MKTPEEIKKGLEYCGNGNNCSYACPYREDCLFGDSRALEHEAFAYIRQLERERNAMLASMKGDPHCCFRCNGIGCTTGKAKGNGSCFEWRGVEEDDYGADCIPRWISVEERLPDEGEKVIVWHPAGTVRTSLFRFDRWWDCHGYCIGFRVVYWMSLPEPPKEDETNED